MGNEEKINEKILSDAQLEIEEIITNAKTEAHNILETAKVKAQKEIEQFLDIAQDDAIKARDKEISGAEMAAKKQVLAQKQSLLEDVIDSAYKNLISLNQNEYEETILDMLRDINMENDAIIILSDDDKKNLKDKLTEKGYKVHESTRDIGKGFIVKNGDIELNYSFKSVMSVDREKIEEIAAQILFK